MFRPVVVDRRRSWLLRLQARLRKTSVSNLNSKSHEEVKVLIQHVLPVNDRAVMEQKVVVVGDGSANYDSSSYVSQTQYGKSKGAQSSILNLGELRGWDSKAFLTTSLRLWDIYLPMRVVMVIRLVVVVKIGTEMRRK